MIQHSVIFKLKYAKGSEKEKYFFEASMKLALIPGIINFQCLRQTSKKNNFDYGLTMKFKSKEDYQAYNDHPDHTRFIKAYWIKGVEDFLEIDYEPL
jgi:heme-degrading monooxygenase HmoA